MKAIWAISRENTWIKITEHVLSPLVLGMGSSAIWCCEPRWLKGLILTTTKHPDATCALVSWLSVLTAQLGASIFYFTTVQ